MGCEPEPIPCRPLLGVIYCLLYMSPYGVPGSPTKMTAKSSTNDSLMISLGIWDLTTFCTKHVTTTTTQVRAPLSGWNLSECDSNSDSNSAVPEIFWHKRQEIFIECQFCAGLGWYHIASLFHKPFRSKADQLSVVFCAKSFCTSFKTNLMVHDAVVLPEATMASV